MDVYDYFQVTVLFFFYAVFIGRTVFLQRTGVRVFVLGIGKKGWKAILEMFFLFILLLWSWTIVAEAVHPDASLLPTFMLKPLFDSGIMKFAGSVLIAMGFSIFMASLASFGSSWRVGIDTERPGQLVTTGVFGFTRNPIFLFMDLYFWGTFLIYSNVFFLVSAAGILVGIHLQILQEEHFLLNRYGEEYGAYMQRVRRYI